MTYAIGRTPVAPGGKNPLIDKIQAQRDAEKMKAEADKKALAMMPPGMDIAPTYPNINPPAYVQPMAQPIIPGSFIDNMSTTTKIAAGVGVVAVLGIGAYFLTR